MKRGENIYKRKDGRWEGRYRCGYDVAGKIKYKSVYASTYADLKKKLAIKKAGEQSISISGTQNFTLADAAIRWLDTKKPVIKESTYAKYHRMVTTHIIPELGTYSIYHMTNLHMERYVQQLLCTGKLDKTGGLAQKTVSDLLMVIKSILGYAVQCGHAVRCDLNSVTVKQKHPSMRVLTEQEQKVLTAYILEKPNRTKLGVLLSLYTGLRLGEICGLQGKHIDLLHGVLYVRQTLQRIQNIDVQCGEKTRVIISSPKSSHSIRDIPIPHFILNILRTVQTEPEAYFLTGDRKYMEPRSMQNHFRRYLTDCRIEYANYHALRHSFATRCIEIGFDVKSLSEILGHTDVKITLNRYVHSSLEQKRQNMEKLTAVVDF